MVVGPMAAKAHGVALPTTSNERLILEIVPSPLAENLERLAALATQWRAALLLQPGDPLPIRFTASLFQQVPIMPLTTNLGDLQVLTELPPGPLSVHDAFRDAEEKILDGEAVLVASVADLLMGLINRSGMHEPAIIEGLQNLQDKRQLHDAIAGPEIPASLGKEVGMNLVVAQRAVVWALRRAQGALTVKEIYRAVSKHLDTTYHQLRDAAESLTRSGALERGRSGTANTYHINEDYEDEAVRRVAAILATTTQPESTAQRAIEILRSSPPPPDDA
ncbi:MAG TPA: hypothetical protein VIJ15_13020 [Dermatophilaceae bacterium]